MAEFASVTIKELLSANDVSAALVNYLGTGNDSRVYPVTAAQDVGYPAVVYSQLTDIILKTKDGPVNNGFDLMVMVMHENYYDVKKLTRLCRQAINQKTVEIVEDHHLDGETSTVRLHITGEEEIDINQPQNVFTVALTFRANKI